MLLGVSHSRRLPDHCLHADLLHFGFTLTKRRTPWLSGYVLQTTHKITVSCLVRHTSKCSNGNSPLRAWKVRFRTTDPSYPVEFLGQTQHTTTKRKTQQHVAQCGKNGAELSHVHTVTSTAYIQSTRVVEGSFTCHVPSPLQVPPDFLPPSTSTYILSNFGNGLLKPGS